MLTTGDQAKADALVRRWRAAVLEKLAPTEVRGWVPMYLVRIDTGRADPAKLTRDLEKLNKPRIKAESLRVSSDQGRRLLAAAAAEAVDGLSVAVNWLGKPRDIPNGSTLESPSGPGGFNNNPATPYSRNAYHWSYLNSGSVQDIGTAEAWTLLDRVRGCATRSGSGLSTRASRLR